MSQPELMRIREQDLKLRQEQESKRLQQQLSQNKVSPRTFKQKSLELEVWVTKEQNQIKRDRDQYDRERARQKQETYYLNVLQDSEQINKILGSARSSQKSTRQY